MAHCIPDMSQETLHMPIDELMMKSHSIYFNRDNGNPEPLVLGSDDIDKVLTMISLILGKILALEAQLFPGRSFPDFYKCGTESPSTVLK